MEQLQVNLIDEEEVDVKAVLSFSTTVMKSTELMAIEEVTEQEIDSAVLAELPSAVIYITAPGDDLWSIGRKYHMPVKAVRELNALESDEIKTRPETSAGKRSLGFGGQTGVSSQFIELFHNGIVSLLGDLGERTAPGLLSLCVALLECLAHGLYLVRVTAGQSIGKLNDTV